MVKIKIKDIKANPFKKEINGGKIKEDVVKKIQANMKELGLMGSLPVFKDSNQIYLIAGHHRLEALKRTYGENFEVEVTLHDYSKENILRGMIIENLTQRSDELLEVTENLNAVRKWLQNNPACSDAEQAKRKDVRGIQDAGSIRDIHRWLNTNGEVMSIGKIAEYLKVYDNLDRDLLKKSVNCLDKSGNKENSLSIEEAKSLARVERKDQKELKEILDRTELDYKGKSKLITGYINASDDLKDKVKKEEINIKDLPIENLKEQIKKKVEEQKKKNNGKITVTDFKQYEREAGNRIGKTNGEIVQTCAFLFGLDNSGMLYELDWNTMLKIVEAGTDSSKNYSRFMEKIREKFK